MDDIFKKASCTNCQDLIDGARIECCECQDFDLCLQCFADGAEIGPHKSNHSYRVIDHLAVRIFDGHDPWTASEHLKLLDAVLGNSCDSWDKISAAVATRTPEECKEEYLARYLNGNLGLATWANVPNSMLHVDIDDQGSSFEKVLAKIPPLDVTFQQAEILGFQPLRDDYERNCYPEAEALVSHLQIDDPSETSIEQSLKLERINMYLGRLRERHRRKRIIKDYQLVAKYFESLNPTKRPPSPAEQELRDKMRPFARFMNSAEFERLISSLTRERELRKRINHLKKVHDKGSTSSQSDVAITSNSVWPGTDWDMLPSSSFNNWKVNLSQSDGSVEESGGGTELHKRINHLKKVHDKGSTSFQSDVAITSNSVWPGADCDMLPSSNFDDWKVNLLENGDTVEESGGGTELRKRISHLKKVHNKGSTSSQSDVAITSNSVWPGADWDMLPSSNFDDWKVNLSESDSENDDTVEESGGGTTLNSVHLMKMGSTSNATYYMEH